MSTRIQSNEILETVKMVADQNFDVRTITIGIDLHDCISPDIEVLNQNIYNKINQEKTILNRFLFICLVPYLQQH